MTYPQYFRLAPIALAAVMSCAHAQSQVVENATLPEVVVQGASADATTENTGRYSARSASTATKLSLSPRETPQSVSVITRTQLDDFGLRNVNDALTYATGIQVERAETDRSYYSARGFDISNFQIDGLGMPFATGEQLGDIDTAVYDRIEVLRGANGLMSSTGNPSATINFIRKRPTPMFQASAGATVGSWDFRRLEGDIAGPLNTAGTVRGRLVVADQHGNSYLDRYSLDKTIVSGILEADLGTSTVLTLGHTYQRNRPNSPMWGTTPLYFTDGTPTNYARSISTATDWAYWDTTDSQSFAELTHDFGGKWKAKASLVQRTLKSDGEMFYVYGVPDAATGLGLFSWPSKYRHREKQVLADMHVTGPVTLGGREHDVVLGASWSRSHNDLLSIDDDLNVPLPSLTEWTGNFSRPDFNEAPSGFADFTNRTSSVYGLVRFNPLDSFKLIAGANVTRVESDGVQYGEAHAYARTKASPYLGAILDLDAHHSVYASYAGIFNPQHKIDANNRILAPIEGTNLEAGVKGEWFNKRLLGSVAVFRTQQENSAEYGGFANGMSYYKGANATSTGFELDVAGQITPAWQVSAGYTQMRIKGEDGKPVRTYVPRKAFHVSTVYKVPQLAGLSVGASMKWQDDIHRVQPGLDLAGNPIVTRQGAYALMNLMARYDISKQVSATLNLNNVTDKKYITSLYWDQGYYGAGRNVMLTMNWKY